MMPRYNTSIRNRGFTLMESLVTLSILGVGVAGVARLQVDLLRAAGQAKARTEALAQVEQQLETLHGWQPGTTPQSSETTGARATTGTNAQYQLDWQRTLNPIGSHYRISVRARWLEGEAQREIALHAQTPLIDPASSGRLLLGVD